MDFTRRHIGLVIAHPDDETLFFAPLLTAFSHRIFQQLPNNLVDKKNTRHLREVVQSAESLSVLCLSTGMNIHL